MTQTMTGTVSGLGQKGGGGFFLRDGNDIFYSCRDAAQRAGVNPGDVVTFQFDENVSNGRTFHNIQGQVTVGDQANNAPTATPTGGASTAKAPASGGQDLRSQTIYRQNCVTNANAMLANQIAAGATFAPSPSEVIQIAREFEKYVSGEEG